ncbi:MAG: DUF4783 domain-containing protein [Bacteroidales bacterium]
MAAKYRFITIILISVNCLLPVRAQTVPAELTSAMKAGNAAKVALFFHESLELTILEKDYRASKNQATRIMENFFREHPPTGFVISFEGTKEKSKYAIGNLTTSKGNFRVNIFFMNMNDKRLVYYMSIEKESQYELSPRP